MDRVLNFLATFKYWLIAIAVLLPIAYMKGCTDGENRLQSEINEANAAAERQAREAGEVAGVAKQSRDETTIKQNEELRNEIKTKSGESVGSNTRRVLDGLRERQGSGNKTTR